MKTIEIKGKEIQLGNLQLVTTTEGVNGSRLNLNKAVIGFEDFNACENWRDKNCTDCEIEAFKIRDGRHFYEEIGRAFESFDYFDYLSELGEDWEQYDEVYMRELMNENDQFCSHVLDEARTVKDGEVLLVNISARCTEVVKERFMAYSEDVWTYAIGIFIPKELQELQEDDE